ncbi:MAG: hypothetical protein J6M54_00970 [Prevotella sp.]|nr:hypothetical protein [Prevotella sp.]
MNTKPTTETNKAIDALCAERDAYKAKCAQLNKRLKEVCALINEREKQLSALKDAIKRAENGQRANEIALAHSIKIRNKYVKALRLIAQAVELSELPKEI